MSSSMVKICKPTGISKSSKITNRYSGSENNGINEIRSNLPLTASNLTTAPHPTRTADPAPE